ncbi:MAG: hypothetical protein KF764_28685 [Labilithrix sp.]|nr:hypothetical protein [Labilithrix sp.]
MLAASAAVVSCSSSDEPEIQTPADAGSESSDTPSEADASADASDADAAVFDGKPLPVVCASTPCATELVTTLGAKEDDGAEGFCVLLADGTVACWGSNGAGQLGRGEGEGDELVDSATAAKVVGLSNVASLDHTCALDKSGGVWCWGSGPFLWGENSVESARPTSPVKLPLPPATNVARTFKTACAIVGAADVRCWGDNQLGQLGPPAQTFNGEPRQAELPEGAAASSLAVGNATFVLRADGSLVSWGGNPGIGRVSASFPDPRPQPVALSGVTEVDATDNNTCALANGKAYCWGARLVPNKGTLVERALPEPVVAPEPLVRIATTHSEGVFYSASNKFVGFKPFRWCAVGASGTLYCWGYNESGQAGTGDQEFVTRAKVVDGLPEKVARVRTSMNTTCALLTNGKVYCWGSNYHGQLGNGLNRGRSFVPTEVVLP